MDGSSKFHICQDEFISFYNFGTSIKRSLQKHLKLVHSKANSLNISINIFHCFRTILFLSLKKNKKKGLIIKFNFLN